jgi:hypothetical protein
MFLRSLIQIRSRRKKATEDIQHSVLEAKGTPGLAVLPAPMERRYG